MNLEKIDVKIKVQWIYIVLYWYFSNFFLLKLFVKLIHVSNKFWPYSCILSKQYFVYNNSCTMTTHSTYPATCWQSQVHGVFLFYFKVDTSLKIKSSNNMWFIFPGDNTLLYLMKTVAFILGTYYCLSLTVCTTSNFYKPNLISCSRYLLGWSVWTLDILPLLWFMFETSQIIKSRQSLIS